jgi:radical SAM superfamily enzyme YgiQ (UPF0313 family)
VPTAPDPDAGRPEVFVVHPAQVRHGSPGATTRADGAAVPLRPMSAIVVAAVARRAGWRVRLIDETREPIPGHLPDLVMIQVWTCLAPSAYQLAGWYRARGVPVVLGGVHASMLPGEALRHADAVYSGEAESDLVRLLDDAAAGRLQPLYEGRWVGMEAVPTLADYLDLYNAPAFRRIPVHSLQTSRGCRFNCSYCSVIRINGRGMRHMEPERVVEEVQLLRRQRPRLPGGTPVYLLDDDLMSDRDYAASMFEALVRAKLRAPLIIQASSAFGRDAEVLPLAARAGCVSVFIGFESLDRQALVEANKKNRPSEYAELVRNIHGHGIGVSAGIIFGFDHDRSDVFDRTVEELERMGVDSARFAALTPLPGTQVFAELYDQGRIVDLDWSHYDGMHTVIQPEHLSRPELQAGLVRAYRRWYATGARARRFARQARTVSLRVAGAFAAGGRRYANDLEDVLARPDAGFAPDPTDLAHLVTTSRAPAPRALEVAAALSRGETPAVAAAPVPVALRHDGRR